MLVMRMKMRKMKLQNSIQHSPQNLFTSFTVLFVELCSIFSSYTLHTKKDLEVASTLLHTCCLIFENLVELSRKGEGNPQLILVCIKYG